MLEEAMATLEGRARMALVATMVQYPMWGSQGSPEAEPTAWSDPKPLQNAMAHVALDSALRSVTGRPMWENPAGVMLWTTGVDYREFYSNVSEM